MVIPQHHCAIVIGGSIAGLLAARVLSEQFERVIIVDRDRLPVEAEARRGVPQSVQPHVLFTQGYRILEQLFPGIGTSLQRAGAIPLDWGKDFRYFQRGHWMPVTESPIGMESVTCTRPLLESTIRQQIHQIPNIELLSGHRVIGLCGDANLIRGVTLHTGQDYFARLIVDASGRGSQTPQWLQDLGLPEVPATVVDPGLGYATRRYYMPEPVQPDAKIVLLSQEAPHQTRLGYLAAVENQEWIATLGGYGRDYPPLEPGEFLQFAQSLSDPAFYQAIAQAEPRSEIRAHRATANRLYHYETFKLPDGLIVIGDAVCALCPVYGQGMTVSAMSAMILRQWLHHVQPQQALSLNGTQFQKQLAQIHTFPWLMATGSDSQFVTTRGALKPNWGERLFQGYVERLANLAYQDVDLHLRFLRMGQMLTSPSVLFHPRLLWKALRR